MIKCEAIQEFTLGRFNELQNVQRQIDTGNKLSVGDTFECSEELAEYLLGKNPKDFVAVKVIEVIPDKPKETKKEVMVQEKPLRKRASKK